MIGSLVAFFSSFFASMLIVRYKSFHEHFSLDSDFTGPQKFHNESVPRIGGISVAIGITLAIIFQAIRNESFGTEFIMLFCAIPIFGIGLIEDITKKISIRSRLLFSIIGALLTVFFLQITITSLGIPYLNLMLSVPIIGVLLSVFAITGLTNAYNIIDGFNGLASMVGIITLSGLGYVSLILGDSELLYLCVGMASAIFGFFVWNYPRGLLFLGDGGAYLIGFWVATISILITFRHHEVSPWFALLINAYPTLETLFTIYRRKIYQNKNPGRPDGIHFHTLMYRRILSHRYKGKNGISANARTSPFMWLLALSTITPAIMFWRSTTTLIISSLCFFIFYIWIYTRIVKFKTPNWL